MRWVEEEKNKVSARSEGYLVKPILSNLDVMLS